MDRGEAINIISKVRRFILDTKPIINGYDSIENKEPVMTAILRDIDGFYNGTGDFKQAVDFFLCSDRYDKPVHDAITEIGEIAGEIQFEGAFKAVIDFDNETPEAILFRFICSLRANVRHYLKFACASDTPAVEETVTPTAEGLDSSAVEETVTPTAEGLDSSAVEETVTPTAEGLDSSAVEETATPTSCDSDAPSVEDAGTPTAEGLDSSAVEDAGTPTAEGLDSSAVEDAGTPTAEGLDSSAEIMFVQSPYGLDTALAKKYFNRAIEKGFMEKTDNGFKWLYGGNRGQRRLGYFCLRVYSNPRPINNLETAFGVKKLSASISNAEWQSAKRADVRQWRDHMDKELFYD